MWIFKYLHNKMERFAENVLAGGSARVLSTWSKPQQPKQKLLALL